MAKIGDLVKLIRGFKVFRKFNDGTFDVCDDNGNCLKVTQNEIYLQNKTITMKAMKDACLTVAYQLAKANNTVTTLEIKTELRRDYPYFYWTQDAVSKIMDSLAGDGIFTYKDNGTYRIYSLASAAPYTGRTMAGFSRPVTNPTLSKTVKAGKGTANTTSVASLSQKGIVKVQKTKIDWQRVLQLANNPQFAGVILANGNTVSKSDIKNQKKSPLGYISPKLGRIKSIVVGNTQYNVK